MTLKNIILAPAVLAKLYKYSLVELKANEKKPVPPGADITFLGGNNKHILLLVNNVDAAFLPGDDLTFLSGILSACKLSMQDIAIVNLHKSKASNYNNVPGILKAEIIIVSGVELSILELPFKIPLFQLQQYKMKKYVAVPSLNTIQHDMDAKKKLWEILKVLFA